MVVTFAPLAWTARMVQDLTDLPSRWTTHAPHWLVSQPTWVPVRPRCSRRNCTSRVRGSTEPVTALPFTVMLTVVAIVSLPEVGGRSSRPWIDLTLSVLRRARAVKPLGRRGPLTD